jgi:Mn2+/Fe2+ NRAMP family transporter
MAHDFLVPAMPAGSAGMATLMLLIIGIVGTTVAPWQLFFQQSYIIDKRLTPRFMQYEKTDLLIGIVVVIVGATALMGAVAAAFSGTAGFGNFTDSAGLAAGLATYAGKAAGALFAVALLDASIIGAFAVSLATAYALGDVLGLKHSLHRGFRQAKGFYSIYAGLIVVAATTVLIPHSPLGLLTMGVQSLAGVLLPSATVFLLLLCNDHAVLGPWVNAPVVNLFASTVVAILVTLSVVLTTAVLFPTITAAAIMRIIAGCAIAGILATGYALLRRDRARTQPIDRTDREVWRMPPLNELTRPVMSTGRKVGMGALRVYLLVAMVLVIIKVTQLALGH